MDPYIVPMIRSKHLLCYPLPVDNVRQSRFLHLQTTHKPRLLNIEVKLYIVHCILLFSWCFIVLLYFNRAVVHFTMGMSSGWEMLGCRTKAWTCDIVCVVFGE